MNEDGDRNIKTLLGGRRDRVGLLNIKSKLIRSTDLTVCLC